MLSQSRIDRCCFEILRLFVILVSALDVYLTVRMRDVLNELNPVGRWLMSLDGGDVALFMAFKLIGTCTACWLMGVVYSLRESIGLCVTTGVALFQLWLMWFLLGR